MARPTVVKWKPVARATSLKVGRFCIGGFA
jgi:hypothetical protein